MSDNWQVGDLALCVDDRNVGFKNQGLRKGKIYPVSRVGPIATSMTGHRTVCLWVDGATTESRLGFSGLRFRKVTPPQADEFDREVIELMTKKKVDTPA